MRESTLRSLNSNIADLSELDGGTPGILLVDMQEYYVSKLSPEIKEVILPAQQQVLEAALGSKYPIAVLEYDPHQNGRTVDRLSEIVRKAKKHQFVTKMEDNGFSNQALDPLLRYWGVDILVMMGIHEYSCVRDTAMEAKKRGYSAVSGKDLISNRVDWGDHDWWANHSDGFFPEYRVMLEFLNHLRSPKRNFQYLLPFIRQMTRETFRINDERRRTFWGEPTGCGVGTPIFRRR